MAKITTWYYRIKGERVAVDVFYTSKKGFFPKGLPDDIGTIADVYFGGVMKENDLHLMIHEALHVYHEKIASSRKVIVYDLKITSALRMNKVGPGHYQGFKDWVPQDMRNYDVNESFGEHGAGYGFTIGWEVLLETSAQEIEYFRINEDGSAGTGETLRHRMVIDWTEKREAAFNEIDSSLEEMVRRISRMVCKPDFFVKMLDSGTKLLPDKTN